MTGLYIAGSLAGADVIGRIGKKRIEFHVVVRRIKTRMVEDVESLDVELQSVTSPKSKVLGYAKIDARLERTDKNVTVGSSESGKKRGRWTPRSDKKA